MDSCRQHKRHRLDIRACMSPTDGSGRDRHATWLARRRYARMRVVIVTLPNGPAFEVEGEVAPVSADPRSPSHE